MPRYLSIACVLKFPVRIIVLFQLVLIPRREFTIAATIRVCLTRFTAAVHVRTYYLDGSHVVPCVQSCHAIVCTHDVQDLTLM
jgi:hypothetical protein